jgi:hypothetical protein
MYASNQFPKQRGCGVEYNEVEWQRLDKAGIFSGRLDGKRYAADLEMRNCECGTTIAVTLADIIPVRWRAAVLAACTLILFATGCGQAWAGDDWTAGDTALQLTYTVAHVMDWNQTLHIVRSPSNEERNSFLGHNPTKQKVNAYFASTLILHTAISHLLPKELNAYGETFYPRTIWQSMWIGIGINSIQYNRRCNMGISLRF